jgi:hypothetical protein
MTGHDLYKRTLSLLGYMNTDTVTPEGDNLLKRLPDILEQICLDLKIPKIKRLSDNIEANDIGCEALCYGVAMMLALVEGDGAKNEIFTKIYNSKRAAALSKIEKIQDKLPITTDGVD